MITWDTQWRFNRCISCVDNSYYCGCCFISCYLKCALDRIVILPRTYGAFALNVFFFFLHYFLAGSAARVNARTCSPGLIISMIRLSDENASTRCVPLLYKRLSSTSLAFMLGNESDRLQEEDEILVNYIILVLNFIYDINIYILILSKACKHVHKQKYSTQKGLKH